jgi:ketosteroid isomerase-like protein
MKKVFLFLFSAVLFIACTYTVKSGDAQSEKNDHSADKAAIMKADSAWDKASEARSAEGWLSFYTDDAIMMPPGENVCKDKSSREASIKKMFAIPGMSLRFQTNKVDIAAAGDMGYAVGVYQWAMQDSDGKEFHETGKYCETWKKQTDNGWKCIVDIWNADPAK